MGINNPMNHPYMGMQVVPPNMYGHPMGLNVPPMSTAVIMN